MSGGARGVPVHEHKRPRRSSDHSSTRSTSLSEIVGSHPDNTGPSPSTQSIPFRPVQQPRRTSTSGKHSIAHLLSTPSPPPPPSWPLVSYAGTLVPERDEQEMDGDDKADSSQSGESGTPESITSVVLSTGSGSEPHGDWIFTLEVIQQPQRARACGFGDKDRRPLSPPPIVCLRVHTSTGQPVDPSHVTIQFLILLVDLWSADGTQERNIVMHPGSQLVRAPVSESLVAGPSKQPSEPWSDTESSYPHKHAEDFRYNLPPLSSSASSPSLSLISESSRLRYSHQPHQPEITGWDPPSTASSQPARLAKPAAIFPPTTASGSGSGSRPVTAPVASPRSSLDQDLAFRRPDSLRPTSSTTSPSRPIFHPQNLPSSSSSSTSRPTTSYSRPSPSYLTVPAHLRPSSSTSRLQMPSQPFSDPLSPSSSFTDHTEMAVRPTSSSSMADRPRTATSAMSGFSGRPSTSGARPSTGSSYPLPTTPTLPQPSPPTYPSTHSSPYVESFQEYGDPSRLQIGTATTAEANYSRVLVGALGCVCQRLLDEDGQPGLFFFAHDLGVRTEGTFRLRFRLTSLTTLMDTEDPTRGEANLAVILSEPFAVYSAKKFPGVIPTTTLTRVFARQNVRLPTRQRRQGRARSEGDSGEEDE